MNDKIPEDIKKNIEQLCPWMALHGWLYVVGGVLYCLSIVGVIIGLPLLIAGSSLLKAPESLSLFAKSNSIDDLQAAIKGQRQFFQITGWIFIICFALPVLLFISMLFAVIFNADMLDQVSEWGKRLPQPSLQSAPYDDFGEGKEI